MLMTAEQALAVYHRAYDNLAYQTACGSIAWMLSAGTPPRTNPTHLAEYTTLTNLLTDTGLECCGHPAYHGTGWTLAKRLLDHSRPAIQTGQPDTGSIQRVMTTIDRYLDRFRQAGDVHERALQTNSQQQAAFYLTTAQHLTEESVRSLSAVPGWQGRTGYHLSAASAGLLRTSTILLQPTDEATLRYAGEKFNRALHDLLAGLTELSQQPQPPALFEPVRAALQKCLEED